MGKDLVIELMDLLLKMENHCNNLESFDEDSVKCKCCNLSNYYGYLTSGCLLENIKDSGLINTIQITMEYRDIDNDNYKNFFKKYSGC